MEKVTHGGRKILVLGIVATLIAMATTGVSLLIYHNSGDIYLDRSRPGFLPDEDETREEEENEKKDDYTFSEKEKITKETLEKYLDEIEKELNAVRSYEKPFDGEVLSDEHLGIPAGVSTDGSVGE